MIAAQQGPKAPARPLGSVPLQSRACVWCPRPRGSQPGLPGWTGTEGRGGGCWLWVLSGMVPCGTGGGCEAQRGALCCLAEPGAVVSYVRRAFCLDCRAASALPLPLPVPPCIHGLWAAAGELAGAGMLGAWWCLWGQLPPSSTPKTMDLPCWGPCGAGQGGLSKDGPQCPHPCVGAITTIHHPWLTG